MKRTSDILTQTTLLEDLYRFVDYPVFFGTTQKPVEDDINSTLSWQISKTTGMIQLSNLVDPKVLYQHQTTTAAIGATWEKHHLAFSNFVEKYRNTNSILEIGGAHGILAKISMETFGTDWLIVEPNPAPVLGCEATFVKDFFPSSKVRANEYTTVVHSHVLEHTYDPLSFLRNIHANLVETGIMIFSVPNLKVWLSRKFLNALNYEHTFFAREEYIDWMLGSVGFGILDKQFYDDGHSIFYAVEKVPPNTDVCPNLYHENKRLWTEFIEYYDDQVLKINEFISKYDKAYLFGAHIFSQFLLKAGVNEAEILGILDNDKNKQSKRLYGTNLSVYAPQILSEQKTTCVVLFAGQYNSEIIAQLNSINSNVDVFVGN